LIRYDNVNYNDFYAKFWDGPEYCSYINQPDCSTILGTATSDGGNMVMNYLTLKLDSYVTALNSGGSIYTQPDIQTSAKLLYFYLFPMVEAIANALIADYENFLKVMT